MARRAAKYQPGTLVEVPHPDESKKGMTRIARVQKTEEIGVKHPIVHVKFEDTGTPWEYSGSEVKLFRDRRQK